MLFMLHRTGRLKVKGFLRLAKMKPGRRRGCRLSVLSSTWFGKLRTRTYTFVKESARASPRVCVHILYYIYIDEMMLEV